MYLELIIIILICMFLVMFKLTRLADRFFKDVLIKMSEFDGEEEEVISSYDEMKMQRESEFDERINGLMAELGMVNGGTDAEVTLKGIYNIPHNSITLNEKTEEIAD